jgi:hypothetical protein
VISPAEERLVALDDGEERLELVLTEDWHGRLGDLRRPHLGHRGDLDEFLVHGPPEEGLDAGVAVVGGRRPPAVEQVDDERLDVLAMDRLDRPRHALCGQEGGELPARFGVGADRLRGEIARVQVSRETSDVLIEGQ